MSKYLWITVLIAAVATSALGWAHSKNTTEEILALIPWPAEVKRGRGEYVIGKQTRLISSPLAGEVAEMLKADFFSRFGITLSVESSENLAGWTLVVRNSKAPFPPMPLPPEDDESYEMLITPDAVVISSHDRAGLYWGTRTLLQLLRAKGEEWVLPAVAIRDRPRFPRRNLLVDPARNFISPAYLKRTVDLLADHKYNVLHLHLTDDQGWRFDSNSYPRLGEVGGGGVYYTQEQLRELVEYAGKRNIEVLPEIDMPGHVSAMLAAYPELSCSARPVEVNRRSGIFPHALCPAKEEVYDFIEVLIGEVADVFPGEFIHIGSDELVASDWESSPACKKLMVEKNLRGKEGLHAYFLNRVNNIITKHGKRTIAWGEVTEFAPDGVVVQAWRKRKYAAVSARRGHETLSSPILTTYLNYSRFILPLRKCYHFDPVPPDLGMAEKELILGGGANMWGNYLKSESEIDRFLFPRLPALAEVYWSPKATRNYDHFKKRLGPIRINLEKRGVKFGDIGFTATKDTFRMAGTLIQAGLISF